MSFMWKELDIFQRQGTCVCQVLRLKRARCVFNFQAQPVSALFRQDFFLNFYGFTIISCFY